MRVALGRAWTSEERIQINTGMSSIREMVEWSFKDLKQIRSRQDYTRMMKGWQAPVALMYDGAALLVSLKYVSSAVVRCEASFLVHP